MTTQRFKPGQTLYTRGLDRQCLPVACRVAFVEYCEAPGGDCVISDGGIHLHARASELHLDPTELRRKCRDERARWRAAVDEQLRQARNGAAS